MDREEQGETSQRRHCQAGSAEAVPPSVVGKTTLASIGSVGPRCSISLHPSPFTNQDWGARRNRTAARVSRPHAQRRARQWFARDVSAETTSWEMRCYPPSMSEEGRFDHSEE